MAFDYKKEYKEFYMPKKKPELVDVPPMNYVAVRGQGDPNPGAGDGDFQRAIGLLYGVAFTIKMSKLGDHRIDGYFDYVVPPLEGFWRQEGIVGLDWTQKEKFRWILAIRLPEFATRDEFAWAVAEASRKKKADFSRAEFLTVREGLCVQCMHVGSYDDEPTTIALMDEFVRARGYRFDFSDARTHHEIYLSDARKVPPERRKTAIRLPVALGR